MLTYQGSCDPWLTSVIPSGSSDPYQRRSASIRMTSIRMSSPNAIDLTIPSGSRSQRGFEGLGHGIHDENHAFFFPMKHVTSG